MKRKLTLPAGITDKITVFFNSVREEVYIGIGIKDIANF